MKIGTAKSPLSNALLATSAVAFMLLGPYSTSEAQNNSRRDNLIEDHFGRGRMNRQRRGDRGHHHHGDPQIQRFRTIDGSFNNLNRETWGAAHVNLWRRAPAAYADGLNVPARTDMPSARDVSNTLCDQGESYPNARGLTDMVWQWGQFLDHDLDLTHTHDPPEPFPVLVPSGDFWFDPDNTGAQLIFLFRSSYNPNTGITTPRQQINEITAWIDGSNVYGSDQETADSLRLFRNGMLRVSANSTGQLLPVDGSGFFLAGDVRANEQVYLTAMHTLFMREHNRVCRRLKESNSQLSDEQLYQHARRRVIATIQSITYNEFLPALMGKDALRPYRGYQPNVFPNITNTFSTAAYRFGHSMLNSTLLRLDNNLNVIPEGNLQLANAFFNPQEIKDHGIEPYLNGLANQLAQEVDGLLVDDIRNFLFGAPGSGGFDLASLNIQRGRDHGLPHINMIRSSFGLPLLNSFADLSADPNVRAGLRDMYYGINRADPWIAMLCEDHVAGASVGATTFAVLKDQFQRLRDGDRFWYQREFSGRALEVIEETRLSNVIRRNTKITRLRNDVFTLPR